GGPGTAFGSALSRGARGRRLEGGCGICDGRACAGRRAVPARGSEGTVLNQKVLQQRDEIRRRRQGVLELPNGRPAVHDPDRGRSDQGWKDHRDGGIGTRGALLGGGGVVLGRGDGAGATPASLAAARRRLRTLRTGIRRAAGGAVMTRCGSAASTRGLRVGAA